MRGRMERCFAAHSNRGNPYARALLLGETHDEGFVKNSGPLFADAPASMPHGVSFECADAAEFLERSPAESFDGFSLSNILDGASAEYERRLFRAVRRAASAGAMVVLRSFREPPPTLMTNCAAADRSMIWGIVDVRRAAELCSPVAGK